MNKHQKIVFLSAALSAAVAGTAIGQPSRDSGSGNGGSTSSHRTQPNPNANPGPSAETSPQAVLTEIHATNQLEIEAGQLAASKGSSAEVRDYGKTLAADHKSADQKVKSLAQRKGIALQEKPSDPQKREQAEDDAKHMAHLKQLSGAQFDREFLEAMASGHQRAIADLEKAKTAVADQDVKKLVEELMPTLHKHEAKADQASKDAGTR